MDLGLTGKTALVTGSSRGIGRAIALALAREGCRVALSSRGGPDLDAAVAEAGAGAVALTGDLSTAEGCDAVAAGALAALGGVDVLVNNVGGSGARRFADADEEDLRRTLERNLWPAFRLSRALVPSMRARGGGAIVMITSIWGREAGGAPSYNVAKAAELSLAKAMARDLAADHIRVNSVAPGSVLFPGGGWERRQQQDPAGIAAFVERELPFGRFGRPEEIADAVVFLCSPRASWIAGACLPVDGCQSRAF
ncbi:MAG TPA: SDR family oxidoreductase [Polyangia bacterium]|nr:SDR family oxidoreductase [Polyangia bacterium]